MSQHEISGEPSATISMPGPELYLTVLFKMVGLEPYIFMLPVPPVSPPPYSIMAFSIILSGEAVGQKKIAFQSHGCGSLSLEVNVIFWVSVP